MRRSGTHRLRAIALVLTLVLGGFGLPLLDTLCFHSTAVLATAPQSEPRLGHNDGGVAHLFGCAVLTSAVSGSGLPALGTPPVASAPRLRESYLPLRSTLVIHSDLAFSQSRAPPIA
jgi:hypothetical protein